MARKTTSPPGARKMTGGNFRATKASRDRLIQDLHRDPSKKISQTVNGVTTRVSRYA